MLIAHRLLRFENIEIEVLRDFARSKDVILSH